MQTNVVTEAVLDTADRLQSFTDLGAAWFVGAGVSGLSGLPLASEIKRLVLKSLAERSTGGTALWEQRKNTWEDAATPVMLEAVLERIRQYVPNVESEISEIFLEGEPSDYHFAIASLLASGRLTTVLTTNFDTLIERAWANLTGRAEDLNVVIDESVDHLVGPSLIKLHGCATKPATIAFTLQRVGQGLQGWKRQCLSTADQAGLVFIGYSDRDKDISPHLSSLSGSWLWLLYNGVSPDQHIQSDSILDRMLAVQERFVVWTNPLEAIRCAFPGDVKKRESSAESGRPWREVVSSVIEGMEVVECRIALVELLRDELSLKDQALEVIEQFLVSAHCDEKARLLLQENIVHGERWELEAVRRNLTEVKRIAESGSFPLDLKAGLLRQQASLAQQESVASAQQAERLFKEEVAMRASMTDELGEAWARHNLAVTLHKQAKHDAAKPYFKESIEVFRLYGQTQRVAQALVNYGALLVATNEDENAEGVYREAIEAFFMLGHNHWLGRCKANLARNLERQGRLTEALETALEAGKLLEEAGDKHWLDGLSDLLAKSESGR